MAKRALITGITGQDGASSATFLLNKGYEPGLMLALALGLTLRYRAGLRCR